MIGRKPSGDIYSGKVPNIPEEQAKFARESYIKANLKAKKSKGWIGDAIDLAIKVLSGK
jgi:hypothetical protein